MMGVFVRCLCLCACVCDYASMCLFVRCGMAWCCLFRFVRLGALIVVDCAMWYGLLFVLVYVRVCCLFALFVCVVCLCGPFVVFGAVLYWLVQCLAFVCVCVHC